MFFTSSELAFTKTLNIHLKNGSYQARFFFLIIINGNKLDFHFFFAEMDIKHTHNEETGIWALKIDCNNSNAFKFDLKFHFKKYLHKDRFLR